MRAENKEDTPTIVIAFFTPLLPPHHQNHHHRIRTQPTESFEVMYSDNGIFGIANGGPSKIVADGYYILTEPLTNGTYPIHFKSSLICPDPGCTEPNFAQDIKYIIIAK